MEFLQLNLLRRNTVSIRAVLVLFIFALALGVHAAPNRENNWLCQVAPNPEMTYILIPNSQFFTLGVPFETNQFGFRDQPVYQKESNTFRILCLGDSVTFGTGVKNEETFPNVLESMLAKYAAPGQRIDVINAGISAYNIRNIRGLLSEYIDEIQPDVVVYTFVENDLDDSVSVGPGGWLMALDPFKSPDEPFVSDDFPAVWLMRRNEAQPPGIFDKVVSLFDNPLATVSKTPPPLLFGDHAETNKRWATFQSELLKMKEISEAAGARLLVTSFDVSQHSEPVTQRVLETCQRIGLPHASSLPIFNYNTFMQTHSLGYDPHFNPLGHQAMADRLFCFLLDEQAIPANVLNQSPPHRHYNETLDLRLAESLRDEALSPPNRIEFGSAEGVLGMLAGVDVSGKMARYAILRLGGPGESVLITATDLVGTPQEPQSLWLEVEGERVGEPAVLSTQASQFTFDLPSKFWDRDIEIRIVAGGPVWVPPAGDRLKGATPQTLMLHRVERIPGGQQRNSLGKL